MITEQLAKRPLFINNITHPGYSSVASTRAEKGRVLQAVTRLADPMAATETTLRVATFIMVSAFFDAAAAHALLNT